MMYEAKSVILYFFCYLMYSMCTESNKKGQQTKRGDNKLLRVNYKEKLLRSLKSAERLQAFKSAVWLQVMTAITSGKSMISALWFSFQTPLSSLNAALISIVTISTCFIHGVILCI